MSRSRTWRVLLTLPFRAGAWRPVVGMALLLSSTALVIGISVAFREITDAVVEGDAPRAERGVVAFVVVSLACFGSSMASLVIRTGMTERTALHVQTELASLAASATGIEHYERPDLLDKLALLREQPQTLAGAPDALAMTVTAVVRIVATAVLLADVTPVLALLPLFAVPTLLTTRRSQRRFSVAWDVAMPHWRLQASLFAVGGSESGGRELRVFGAQDAMRERFATSTTLGNEALHRAGARAALEQAASWSVFGLGFAAGMTALAQQVVDGRATAGGVVLVVTLASQLTAQLGLVAGQVALLGESVKVAERYLWLLDWSKPSSGSADVPATISDGITFRSVGFRYPGTDAEVLRDVDLFLPAGATVAVVGANGAGKTTIAKLLTRMYEPTTGRIEVDGTDLATYDASAWRERVSAAFQDHAHLEVLARETVGLGRVDAIEDEPAARTALDRAGALDVVDALPRGLSTQLGQQWSGGVELSGGQWQKLALGRAMRRSEPLLLILDEPTAALDALAEATLFERYAGVARDAAASSGAITVLVSHRFSTVRTADLIVVVAGQRIAECGTHAELVAVGGLYAELYDLQARGYR